MIIEYQISVLYWFLKDRVTLKTGVKMLKIQLCQYRNKLHSKIYLNRRINVASVNIQKLPLTLSWNVLLCWVVTCLSESFPLQEYSPESECLTVIVWTLFFSEVQLSLIHMKVQLEEPPSISHCRLTLSLGKNSVQSGSTVSFALGGAVQKKIAQKLGQYYLHSKIARWFSAQLHSRIIIGARTGIYSKKKNVKTQIYINK